MVDANVLVQASIEEAGMGRLVGHELIAPPIMASETVSTLREMTYRGEITERLAKVALERFRAFRHGTVQPAELWQSAWDIATELGWAKTYDAEYVALARLMGCPLVTLDARLKRGAGRLVQILGVAELPA